MKKIFTLCAAFAACFAANAADYEFSLEDLPSGWKSSYDATTKTISYEEAWAGRGWWLGDQDLSAYEQVVIELASPLSGYAQVCIQYAYEGEENKIVDSAGGANSGATKLVVEINPAANKHIKQIFVQNSAAGNIKLKRAYCPEVLNYQAAKDLTDKVSNNVIMADAFNGYSDKARVKVNYTATGTADYQGWGIGEIQGLGGKSIFTIQGKTDGAGTASITFADIKEALATADAYGSYGILFNFYGQGNGKCTLTLNSVTIEEVVGFSGEGYKAPSSAGINTVGYEFEDETPMFNILGQRVYNAKGLVIVNGKKVIVK